MSQAECIHGLEAEACDVCAPRAAPMPPARRRAPDRAPAPRSTRATPGVAVRTVASRRYLVVHRDRLPGLLAAGPITDDEGWRTELGESGAFDPIRWDDARVAARAADLVVLVGSGPDPDHLELVAVANQPARAHVQEVLAAAGRSPRLVLNPAWFG